MKISCLLIIVLIQFLFSGLVYSQTQRKDTIITKKTLEGLELTISELRELKANLTKDLDASNKLVAKLATERNSLNADLAKLNIELSSLKTLKTKDSSSMKKDIAEYSKLKVSNATTLKELEDWKNGKYRFKSKADTIISIGILKDLIDYKSKNPALTSDKSIVNKKEFEDLQKFKNDNSRLSQKNIRLEEVNTKFAQNLKISRDSVITCLTEKATLITEKLIITNEKAKIIAQRDSVKLKNNEFENRFKVLMIEKEKLDRKLAKAINELK